MGAFKIVAGLRGYQPGLTDVVGVFTYYNLKTNATILNAPNSIAIVKYCIQGHFLFIQI